MPEKAQRALLRTEDAFSRAVLDHLADAISVNVGLTRVYVNDAYLELHGLRDKSEAIGRPIDEHLDPAQAALLRERALRQQRPEALPSRHEYKISRKDGVERHVEVRAMSVTFEGNLASLSILRDITERVTTEAKLNAALSLNAATLESTGDGILVVDLDGRIVNSNRRFSEMWGVIHPLPSGASAPEFFVQVLGLLKNADRFLERIREVHSTELQQSFDVIDLVDGRVFERLSLPQKIGDTVVGRVWNFRDVTNRHAMEDQLRHMAFHDSLTGLANRIRFADRLEHAIQRAHRANSPVYVLYIDFDDFKAVNDQFGHSSGDQAITVLANRIVQTLRVADTAARLGGDEFGLLLEDLADLNEAILIAERILAVVREPFLIEDHEIAIDASIGISGGDGTSVADDLLRNADIAMYAAKRKGKGRWHVYERGMRSLLTAKQTLITDLRHALERDELTVHFQPGIELRSGRMVAAEALMRWNHPIHGLLTPATFIHEAEESGVIDSLGDFVLRKACTVLSEWQSRFPDALLMIGVNVSPRQLRDERFSMKVEAALDAQEIDPRRLLLEITESAVLDDPIRSMLTLQKLKELNVSLALDDFGTGYSSLSYLKDFPIDVLKIDQSFIEDIALSQKDALLTSATITLGHELGLRVIAEGIERPEQLAKLIELNCEFGQGYLFSKPLAKEDLDKFVHEHSSDLGMRAA
jgi:diguanylate cyclase (GGDEF)-like protein/PAS domain S-box-containing protein